MWHGHTCHLTLDRQTGQRHKINPINGKDMDDLYRETQRNSKYIRDQGYDLEEMWECQWLAMKRDEAIDCKHYWNKTWRTSEEKIIEAVRQGQLFGVVECDIRVPDDQKATFAEMPPIFKNVDVTKDDIGDYMKEFAEQHGIMTQPRRLLIGSMFGEKILLTTPYLKWCLDHGLQVTKIYQVIEWEGDDCFAKVGERISQARRDGDADSDKKALADMEKLLGNSYYGKTVTDKERHKQVLFSNGETFVQNQVNQPLFHDLNPITDSVYEITMNKKVIRLDLPLQIGFFVYQYAKVRMLSFYYDYLMKFLDWQLHMK